MTESWFLRAAQYLNAEFSLGLRNMPEIKMARKSVRGVSRKKTKPGQTLALTYFLRYPAGNQQATREECKVIINQRATQEGNVFLLGVLLHELIHCSLPPEEMHGRAFLLKARACGLKGNPTATYAGTSLSRTLQRIIEELSLQSQKAAACKTAQ